MVRWFVLFVVAGILSLFVQGSEPDYSIRNIRNSFSEDGRQAMVQFEVWNIGNRATRASTAILNSVASGQEVSSESVPALDAQEIHTVTLAFATNSFQAGSQEMFRAAVGIDEVETSGSPNIQDNFAQITITFPNTLPSPEATSEPGDQNIDGNIPSIFSQFIEQVRGGLNLSDPAQIPIVAAIVGAVALLLFIILFIFRLLFQRPPEFGNWQPPYVNMLPLDPNTLAGRRQQWQLHAQNSSLPTVQADGDQFHARKLPTDVEGSYLTGWHITGIRTSQYDMYGRVNRSQTIAPRGLAKRLDKLCQKRSRLTLEQLQKHLRPVARKLATQLNKKINERNAPLPIALDIRLTGRHGDVHIWFELFHGRYGQWTRIDRWQPEMTVAGKTIDENFTYTLHGLRPEENLKTYRKRLQNDFAQLLLELVSPVIQDDSLPKRSAAPTDPHLLPVSSPE